METRKLQNTCECLPSANKNFKSNAVTNYLVSSNIKKQFITEAHSRYRQKSKIMTFATIVKRLLQSCPY